jgi:hypothetical protein
MDVDCQTTQDDETAFDSRVNQAVSRLMTMDLMAAAEGPRFH